MKKVCVCVWVIFIIFCQLVENKNIYVEDFGARANDNLDDTNAIQLAVNTAINTQSPCVVNFGPGIYNVSSTIFITNATNLTIAGQGMSETILVGNHSISIFLGEYCQGLIIRSLSIDFDPLPFTAGYVVNISSNYVDVKVIPPHRTNIDQQVYSMFRFDPIAVRGAFGPKAYQIFQKPPENHTTTLISSNVLRLPLQTRSQFVIGDPIVAMYTPGIHTIVLKHTSDITIQSITLYASWYMGLFTFRVTRINITDFHTEPRIGHWLSTNADCIHLIDSREYIYLTNSKCHLNGDDAINVNSAFLQVTKIINSTALVLKAMEWPEPVNIGNNVTLEFTSEHRPFTTYASSTVLSSTLYNSTDVSERLFHLNFAVEVNVGDWAFAADQLTLTIRNFTVQNNRGRGALIETRNVDIQHSIFNRTSAPALFFQPSNFWREGPGARNVTLSRNLYINCNEGISQHKGIITFLPEPVQTNPVIEDIRIQSSTFYFGNFSQGLIQGNNINNILLTGNYIATNNSLPLITICNSRNMTARNNTVINTQTKIDQYYAFDQSHPCQMNLSSLIDLPLSAFNSSFLPPV